MQVSLKKALEKNELKQFISYFCVGGCAAIVEWLVFALLTNVVGIYYLMSTTLAFLFSTATNWGLGRIWTFRNSSTYKGKLLIEGVLIYAVSGIGLVFNLGLMFFFVTLLRMNSPIKKVIAKIIATGIVFFWNYFARKSFIYRSSI